MNKPAIAFVAALLAVVTAGAAQDQPPEMPKPQKEHGWLQQLAGEWTYDAEMYMAPGQPPAKASGTESSRLVGGFWLLNENKGEFFNMPFHGVMTLGYSPEKKKYVATWVDSIMAHLWHYEGTVDDSGKTLTLHTNGPDPERPGTMVKFKETLEIKDKDTKVFTSSMEKDGKWQKCVVITSRRKK